MDCSSWVYDTSVYATTFISEDDIVCDDEWKGPLAQTIFFCGVLVSLQCLILEIWIPDTFSILMGIWNLSIQNPETFEIRTFWRSDFKWSGFSYGYIYSPNHWKTGPFKIWTFMTRFQWFLTKWWPYVRNSNGFPITFEIQTICNPTSFQPFEIQTSQDFRPPLYSGTI